MNGQFEPGNQSGKTSNDTTHRKAVSAVKAALEIALPAAKEAAEWNAWLNHPDKNIRFEAFKLAMAYRHGKPIQPVSGAPIDAEPIKVQVDYMGASPEFFAKMAAKLGLK